MRRLLVLGLVGALAFTFVGAPTSRAATVSPTWPVGAQPFGLALDEQTGKVYVANSGSVVYDINNPSSGPHGLISVVDPATGSVARILTSQTSNVVLVDSVGRRLYSSNGNIGGGSGSVDIFNLDSEARLTSVPVGGLGMALDRAAGRLYVCESGSLQVIDTTTFEVLDSAPAPTSAAWFSVAVDPHHHRVYLTNIQETSPRLFVLDDRDLNAPALTIDLPSATRFAIAVDPVTEFLFVASGQWDGQAMTSAFSVISPDTLRVVHQISFPGFALGMALAPARHRIYISDNNGWRIYGIDDRTFEVAETVNQDRFTPGMLTMHTNGRLFVGNYDSRSNQNSSLLALDLNNHAPVFQSLDLTPALPLTNDALHADALATDPDLTRGGPAPVTYTYQWERNHSVIQGANSSTLDLSIPGNGDSGDYIVVTVTASDGEMTSSASGSVVVGDTWGVVFVDLSNPAPRTDENLMATVRLVDPDNESYRCNQAYYVNGVFQYEVAGCIYTHHLIVHGWGDRGDTIEVRATVIDAYGKWTAVGSVTAVVADSQPVIDTVSLSDVTPTSRDVLVASVTRYDADGDPMTLTYNWMVNGISQQTTTTAAMTDSFDLRPKGHGDNGDVITVAVVASDGTLVSRSRDASATVTPGRNR